MCVKAKPKDEKFIPLKLEFRSQDTEQSKETEEDLEILNLPEAAISERDWKLNLVHKHIEEELKKKGKETLTQLNKDYKKPEFIQ